MVFIWNVAAGSSEVSACTEVLIPMFARAPRITPHGKYKYYISGLLAFWTIVRTKWTVPTACAIATASVRTAILILENGRKA